MERRIYLNNDWEFSEEFDEKMLSSDYSSDGLKKIRIPHTVKETSLHYFDEHEYQMVSCYIKNIEALEEWKGKKLLLTIDGAAHYSEVFLNGEKVGEHKCGYTAFTIDISDKVVYGNSNRLVVKLDSRENLNIPPFGYVIDYMTYGGIYRDVYIDIKENSYIEDVFVSTKQADVKAENEKMFCNKSKVSSKITLANAEKGMTVRQLVARKGEEFKAVAEYEIVSEDNEIEIIADTGKIELWDVDNPALYSIKTQLMKDDKVIDENTVVYGYRKAVFKKDGFYLNGRKLKIRGLNRHQSYPYVGCENKATSIK